MKVLKDIQVLDLGNFITAPFAAMLLAELGANVIKVERPGQGDPFRSFKGGNYSPQFQAHNRNKRSLTLDYTKPQGLELFDQLVARADVLLINTRPGVEKKLNIDYERLREINPALVYCSITGFGASGPYATRPAYDNVGQAVSGWLSLFHAGSDPRVAGPAISDTLTGLYACIGILGALVERSKTGQGRNVEVSMLEAMIGAATEPLGTLFASGRGPTIYGRAAVSQSYVLTCKDGLRIGLHLSSPEKFWQGLVAAIERPDLLERFPTREVRVERYEELANELAQTFAQQDRHVWIEKLSRHDVPFAQENRLDDLADDPQVKHLNVFYTVDHSQYGPVQAANRPIRFDGDNTSSFLPPPALGEHTHEILTELGISEATIRDLKASDVI